ncbi:MAG: RNA polymerase factor sigma-32 [Bdellovibrionaceae bacterium]|nr:RNA polymerase factor sigma-32 [Pseudobdellovibrionaceae bacterium]
MAKKKTSIPTKKTGKKVLKKPVKKAKTKTSSPPTRTKKSKKTKASISPAPKKKIAKKNVVQKSTSLVSSLQPEVLHSTTKGKGTAEPVRVQAEIVDNALALKGSSELAPLADGLTTYLANVNKYPLLTRAQEEIIAKRYYEKKNPQDAEILVTSNLRFVVKVAAEYAKFGHRILDLIQEGNVGLMHAVKEFNPHKGVRLITYAVWWIRGYIQEYLMRQHSLVRIGTTQNQRKLFYHLQKQKNMLDQLGQEPSVKLLAAKLGVPEDDVRMMEERMSGGDISLDAPLSGEGDTPRIQMETNSEEIPVDEDLAHKETLSMLEDRIEELRPQLSEKEVILLDRRILADDPVTLQDIGSEWGVTREAVRQMESRLIKKIKDEMLKTE